MDDHELTLRALALVELIGTPIGAGSLDDLHTVIGLDGFRMSVQLACMLRAHLESHDIPPEAWCAEWRAHELADEMPPGMA
jgi:hypothetical protein